MSHVLHVVTNGKQEKAQVLEIWQELFDCVDYLHIREKHRTAQEVWDWGADLHKISHSTDQIIINDRIDVGMALGCGGVQLAHHSLPVSVAKTFLPPYMLIGASVHHLDQAKLAEAAGASYLLFGHVFDSPSKPGLQARGLNQLREIVESVSIPVIAIGGITPERVLSVLETGCAGVAVMSAILEAPDPRAVARAFRLEMDKGKHFPTIPWNKKL